MQTALDCKTSRRCRPGQIILVTIIALGLASCAIGPITPQDVKEHLTVITPPGPGKFPVVIFFQGTGGGNRRAKRWAKWFAQRGVASAMVDNAGMRYRNDLWGLDDYVSDAVMAWDLLTAYPKIDRSRFALMGFSRGGRQTLKAGAAFGGQRAVPDFAFAFYPGGESLNTCTIRHADSTKVHIFYGTADQAGKPPFGFFRACLEKSREMDNVEFHAMPGAHHGFDDEYAYTFTTPVSKIQIQAEPNPQAVAKTKEIIWKAIKEAWGL